MRQFVPMTGARAQETIGVVGLPNRKTDRLLRLAPAGWCASRRQAGFAGNPPAGWCASRRQAGFAGNPPAGFAGNPPAGFQGLAT